MPPHDLEARIGHRFSSRHLLEEALRHGSAAAADGERSYERLEFLGDAVLNLCVAREVYRMLPLAGEGVLTRARAAAINNRNLVRVGERIGLPEALTTDPSVRKKGSGVTRKMVADAVEAVAGAVFLDGGFEAAAAFVRGHFRLDDLMGELVAGFDAKSRLQEWCQRTGIPLPSYRLVSSEGPAHERTFRVEASVAGYPTARGEGRSKKEAEMAAAGGILSHLAAAGEEGW
ncbi:MAG TPA: ribonuclease III [Candidatus Deferrimicrobiaceae bacterium]